YLPDFSPRWTVTEPKRSTFSNAVLLVIVVFCQGAPCPRAAAAAGHEPDRPRPAVDSKTSIIVDKRGLGYPAACLAGSPGAQSLLFSGTLMTSGDVTWQQQGRISSGLRKASGGLG